MWVRIPPAPPCDVSGHRGHPEPSLGSGCLLRGLLWAGWAAGGLVVPAGVEGEFAEQFAGGGVDDADVQVLDEHQDGGPGVGAADADVVELAAGAEGDVCRLVPMRSVRTRSWASAGAVAGGGFGPGCVGGGGGGPVRQGAVRPPGVVDGGEGVQQGLQLGGGWRAGRAGRGASSSGSAGTAPLCPGSGGGSGLPFFCVTPRRRSSVSKPLRPPRPPANRVVNTIPLSVSVEAGTPCAATAARNAASTIGPVTRLGGDRQRVAGSGHRARSGSRLSVPSASG